MVDDGTVTSEWDIEISVQFFSLSFWVSKILAHSISPLKNVQDKDTFDF